MVDNSGFAALAPQQVARAVDPEPSGVAPIIGMPVPAFSLSNQFGEIVDPSGMVEDNYFLVFYPFAFSGVCGSELKQLQTVVAEFGSRGVGIYGVSVDHKYALRAYAQQMGISFGLLADFWPHGAVSRAFGCFDEERGMSTRSTFLVSSGLIAAHFSTPIHQARGLNDYRSAMERLSGRQ